MINEHDCIVLTQDVPDEGLQGGDVGTVVHIYQDGAAYEVEFVTLAGQTVAVATVLPTQLRPVGRQDIAHAREMPVGERQGASVDRDMEGVDAALRRAARRARELGEQTGTPVYVLRDGKIVDLTAENRLKKAQESGQKRL